MTPRSLSILALTGVPRIRSGDDLPGVILAALENNGLSLQVGDILVLAQKIVSKAEGRQVFLADVAPSPQALELAQHCGKDPRLVELVLSEADEVMRVRPGVLIVRHRLGLVLANAGIDQSNIDHEAGPSALLLPLDPDASCAHIRAELHRRTGTAPAVLIIDSLGRAWRQGTIGTAIGASGLPALLDLRGRPDLYGRELETSELGLADEVAAASSLVMGQADEACPIVLVRGLPAFEGDGGAANLVRPLDMDLFP